MLYFAIDLKNKIFIGIFKNFLWDSRIEKTLCKHTSIYTFIHQVYFKVIS